MALDPRKRALIEEGDTFGRASINAGLSSINGIVHVADMAELAGVFAAMAAAGTPVSTANPVASFRANAVGGFRLEVSTGTNTTRAIPDVGLPPTSLTPDPAWAEGADGGPTVYRDGATVFFDPGFQSKVTAAVGWTAGAVYTVATGIPADLCPTAQKTVPCFVRYSASSTSPAVPAVGRISTGGVLTVRPTASGTIPVGGLLDIGPASWRYSKI